MESLEAAMGTRDDRRVEQQLLKPVKSRADAGQIRGRGTSTRGETRALLTRPPRPS